MAKRNGSGLNVGGEAEGVGSPFLLTLDGVPVALYQHLLLLPSGDGRTCEWAKREMLSQVPVLWTKTLCLHIIKTAGERAE